MVAITIFNNILILRVLPFSSTNKTDSYDMTEILLKLALSTTSLTLNITTLQHRQILQ
jgi:hypothetical protein